MGWHIPDKVRFIKASSKLLARDSVRILPFISWLGETSTLLSTLRLKESLRRTKQRTYLRSFLEKTDSANAYASVYRIGKIEHH